MWLRLYQSASIWLVFGLSRAPTHNSTLPQVQIGLRPIASRIAAARIKMEKAAIAVRRRVMSQGLAERSGLQSAPLHQTDALHVAHLRTRLRRKRDRSKGRTHSRQ